MTNYDREKIVVSKQWLVVREKDDNVRGNESIDSDYKTSLDPSSLRSSG